MSEEKQEKWNKFEHEIIPGYVARINDLEADKKDLITELAEKIKLEYIMPTYMICAFLKNTLKRLGAEVSEKAIERALGDEYKEQKNVIDDQRHVSASDDKKAIEVSSSGEQQVHSEPRPRENIFEKDVAQLQSQPQPGSQLTPDQVRQLAIQEYNRDMAQLENDLRSTKKELAELKQQQQAPSLPVPKPKHSRIIVTIPRHSQTNTDLRRYLDDNTGVKLGIENDRILRLWRGRVIKRITDLFLNSQE
jgi:ribosomal protein L29